MRKRKWDLDDILAVRWSQEIAAQRYAVLLPIVGRHGVEEPPDLGGARSVRRAMRDLRHCWLKSLASLRAARWKPAEDRVEYWRMTHCPPFGVVRRGVAFVCGRRIICPYCWARRTSRDLYQRLVWTEGCVEKMVGRSAYLLEWHLRWREQGDASPGFLAALFRDARSRQESVVRGIGKDSAGHYVLSTIEPLDAEISWLTHQRGVAVLTSDMTKPPDLASRSSDHDLRLLPFGSSTIAAVVGRVTAYPAQLLRGPAAAVAALLNQRSATSGLAPALRMVQVRGVLRNRSLRKRLQAVLPEDQAMCEVRLSDDRPTAG